MLSVADSPFLRCSFLPINLINCKMCQLFIFSTTCFSSSFCPFLFIFFSDVIANSKWPNIKICQFKHLMFSIFYTEHRRAPKLMRNANCSFVFICISHSLRFCEKIIKMIRSYCCSCTKAKNRQFQPIARWLQGNLIIQNDA